MPSPKRVAFHTLGCKLNFAESSTLMRTFREAGFEPAKRSGATDIYVVNTCAVTAHAEKKCRNLIRRLGRGNPGAFIAVTGCYAQLRPAEVAAIEGVSLVVGNDAKGTLVGRTLADLGMPGVYEASGTALFFPAFSGGDRTRSFLKVQDGCGYHCSYCTVPLARGDSRNAAVADLVCQARRIAAAGQREIVLTGINTGDFGRATGESFPDLLRALDKVEGIDRYRISSIEPNLLTDEIIAFTARSPKFQPHFHIPLQSGSDRILGLMRRRYTSEQFANRVTAVREAIPDVFIGIDVIVGFPGETEEDFAATRCFLEQLKPADLHVFPYSVRPGTPAADFPDKVPAAVATERAARLGALSDRLHRDFCTAQAGRRATVLWESTCRDGDMLGYTENYIRVRAPYDRACVNTLTEVMLGAPEADGTVRATGGVELHDVEIR